MKINYLQADFLYWVIQCMGETSYPEFNPNSTEFESYDHALGFMQGILAANEFPPEPIFDNDWEPMIAWESYGAPEGFSAEDWLFKNTEGDEDDRFNEPYKTQLDNIMSNPSIETIIEALKIIRVDK